MNSRERVHALLNHEPVDRIPNALGGCETASLHCVTYDRLKRVLGVKDAANRIITFMTNSVVEPSVLQAMQGDVVLLASGMCPSRLWGPDAQREWKTVRIWDIELQVANAWDFRQDDTGAWWWNGNVCQPGSLYFDPPVTAAPLAAIMDEGEGPSPRDFHPPMELPQPLLKRLEEDARWLYENTPYAIACGEIIHDLQLKPGGMEAWWMRMVSEPDACHEFLDKAVDAALSQLRQLDQAIGKYCAYLGIADDMGDSRGVMIGPKLWRSIYKPHYKRLFTEWHKITRMKVNLHTCGAVGEILEDLIECGVDIYNPVQLSANGMDPKVLKQKAGNRLVFLGGAYDAICTPADTSPDTVYERAVWAIREFSRNGGYMFAGVHNMPGNMPESHLEALLRAYRDCAG